MKHSIKLSAFILALGYCSVGYAQTASTDKSALQQSKSKYSNIEEIVVTGERRTENLMKAPITASVISGGDIQNRDIVNVNSLQFVAPNMTVNDLGQGIDFNIRGIGKGEHNTQTPVGVVTYRDGAATFPGYMTAEPYYDIKSVEVYRGPQGTFVGQNATGGAVFVTTNDPTLGGSTSGYAQLQYGNYNDAQAQGAVDIPITNDLAARIAVFGERRDSFYTIIDRSPADNCPNNQYAGCKPGYNPGNLRQAAARISVLWQPINPLTVSLKFDIMNQNFGASPAVPYSQLLPLGAPVAPYGVPNPYHDSNLFHVTANAPSGRSDRENRTILKIAYLFDNGVKLQSVSDYNQGNGMWRTDLDLTDYGNPSDIAFFGSTSNWTFYDSVDETVVSEELDLISPNDQPVTWVAGLYWQTNTYYWRSPYQFWIAVGKRFPGGPTPSLSNLYQYTSWTIQGKTPNRDIAGFGQVRVKLADNVSVSLGARWTQTRSHNDVDLWSYGNGFGVTTFTPSAYQDIQTQQSSAVTYKAAVDWSATEDDFLYAFIATGYTGGGLNTFTSATGGPAPFGKVTDTDYELGWKRTSWFDGRLRTQVNAFYTEYKDYQITLSDPLVPLQSYEINLPKTTKMYGMEAEGQASFGRLSMTATIGLLKSKLADFWASDPRYRFLASGTCDPSSGGTDPYCVNVGGNPITYAPKFTYNFMVQYMIPVGNGDTLTPRISFAHVSAQWASVFDDTALGDRLGARNLLGAQLEYESGQWIATLYGDNILNKQYVASNNSGGLYAGPPRQFGIRVSKVF